MFQSIVISLIANLLSTALITLVGISIYFIFYWKNRIEKLNFFGIGSASPSFRIFLSRVQIKTQGTEGHIPVKRGFTGPAIIKLEYEAGLMIQEELESKTLALLPKKFRDWLGTRSITLKLLKVPVEISPASSQYANIKDYLNNNSIVLGSSMYNLIAKYYLDEYMPSNLPFCCFYENKIKETGEEERVIGIRNRDGDVDDVIFRGRSYNREIGFIQRINHKDTKTTSFLCVGHGSAATYGTVRYLINEWRELDDKFSSKQFIVCLAFVGQGVNDEAVVQPKVIEMRRVP